MHVVVAIIVTFNRLKKLQSNFELILGLNFLKVIVVNNASTDGTKEWLDEISHSKYKNKLHVIHSNVNTGGAGGFSLGISEAHEKFLFDWFLLFDDDAYPDTSLLSKFYINTFPDDVGAVACAVYDLSGEIVEMNRPSLDPFMHVSMFLKRIIQGRKAFHIADVDYSGSNREIDVASFVGLFVRHKLLYEGLGLPMKELFIYVDDVEYCRRICKMGYRIIFSPSMLFYHDIETFTGLQNSYEPLWKAFYRYRNSLFVYKNHAGVLYPLVLIWKIWEWFWNYRFYDSKYNYFQMYFHAIFKGCFSIFNDTPEKILKKYSSK